MHRFLATMLACVAIATTSAKSEQYLRKKSRAPSKNRDFAKSKTRLFHKKASIDRQAKDSPATFDNRMSSIATSRKTFVLHDSHPKDVARIFNDRVSTVVEFGSDVIPDESAANNSESEQDIVLNESFVGDAASDFDTRMSGIIAAGEDITTLLSTEVGSHLNVCRCDQDFHCYAPDVILSASSRSVLRICIKSTSNQSSIESITERLDISIWSEHSSVNRTFSLPSPSTITNGKAVLITRLESEFFNDSWSRCNIDVRGSVQLMSSDHVSGCGLVGSVDVFASTTKSEILLVINIGRVQTGRLPLDGTCGVGWRWFKYTKQCVC